MNRCIVCNKEISDKNTFCSQKCCIKDRANKKLCRDKMILDEWLSGNLDNCILHKGPEIGELSSRVKRDIIKPYLMKLQNNLCTICKSPNVHNSKPLVFILDHIDGDWNNNYKENLRMICPNCNSQLDTTKHNRGRGRYATRYYQKKHRENLR